jgi:hypothetical protein
MRTHILIHNRIINRNVIKYNGKNKRNKKQYGGVPHLSDRGEGTGRGGVL